MNSDSTISKLISMADEVVEVNLANEESIGLIQELTDHHVLTSMTQSTEILLFLLFEYQHIVAQLCVHE